MLDVMERYLDHIRATFGTGPGQKRGYCGHQEIEIALIKLYHLTGEKKQLDLAAYFIDERGRQPHYFDIERDARHERPAPTGRAPTSTASRTSRSASRPRSSATRCGRIYMYTAMADLAAELGDASLKRACETLWQDVTSTRMYVTGGFGPSASNEGFTSDYDLPNDTAYAETCASVAMIFWAQRMLNLDLDGEYADVLERALYNGALSGLSRDGENYFYDNKLESDGRHRRWAWHACPCCTMNVSRLVASIGGYFYSTGDDVIAMHLYGGNTAELEMSGRRSGSRRPAATLGRAPSASPSTPRRRPLQPAPAHPGLGARRHRHGQRRADRRRAGTTRGYLDITRDWQGGDTVELDLPMPPERIFAQPERPRRCRPGRAPPRAAGLLPRGRPTIPAPRSASSPCRGAPRSTAEREAISSTASSRLTARGRAVERRRLGRHALPRRSARRASGDPDRGALLSLGQPRAGRDGGLGPRGTEEMADAAALAALDSP